MDSDSKFVLSCVLMVCVFVMFFEYFIVLQIQGNKSSRAGTRTKEDNFGKTKQEPTQTEIYQDILWKKIVRNHLETVPFSFIIFFLAVFVTDSSYKDSHLALIILMVLYVFFRILYTVFFAGFNLTWRSANYLVYIANLCVLGGGLVGVIDAFQLLKHNADLNIDKP